MKKYTETFTLLGEAIAQQGSDDFFASLGQSFIQLPGCGGHVLALYYPHDAKPQCLYHNCTTELAYKLEVQDYIDGPYIFDPYYQASLEGINDDAYRLNDIAPDDFKKTEYFKHYYKASNLADEISYLVALPNNDHIHFSISPYDISKKFPVGVANFLYSLGKLIPQIIKRHWQLSQDSATAISLSNVQAQDQSSNNLNQALLQALNNFGCSLLTPREQEVVQLILRGHSRKSSAKRLNISPETIKLHCKNIYQKLDINTLSELFYLFIDSLASSKNNIDGDPLQSYMKLNKSR